MLLPTKNIEKLFEKPKDLEEELDEEQSDFFKIQNTISP